MSKNSPSTEDYFDLEALKVIYTYEIVNMEGNIPSYKAQTKERRKRKPLILLLIAILRICFQTVQERRTEQKAKHSKEHQTFLGTC